MAMPTNGYMVQDGWLYSGAVRLPIRAEQVAPSVSRVERVTVGLPVRDAEAITRKMRACRAARAAITYRKHTEAARARLRLKYGPRPLTAAERIGCSGPVVLPFSPALAIARDRWYRAVYARQALHYKSITAKSTMFLHVSFKPYDEIVSEVVKGLPALAFQYKEVAQGAIMIGKANQPDVVRDKKKVVIKKGGPIFKSFEEMVKWQKAGTRAGRTKRVSPGALVSATIWIDSHLRKPDGMFDLLKVQPDGKKVKRAKAHTNLLRKSVVSNEDGSSTINGRFAITNIAYPLVNQGR